MHTKRPLIEWVMDKYNLQRDKEQNTARWRALQPTIEKDIKWLEKIVADVTFDHELGVLPGK